MTTSFSELLRESSAQEGKLELEVPSDWLQGRSLFGGLQAALAVRAMRSLVPSQPLRSLQTNFIAPLANTVRAEAIVLRKGKNTTQVEARLMSDTGLATQCMAIFGSALSSTVAVTLQQPEVVAEAALAFPFVPGLTPNFIQHFGMRMLRGHPPFSGIETRESVLELDFKDQGPATESHIIALADVVPPLGLSYLRTPTFGSTLSWMLTMLIEPVAGLPLTSWRLDSELVSAKDGYTEQSNTLWSPDGQALLLSRQCMLVFG